jgi:hypothetical protein
MRTARPVLVGSAPAAIRITNSCLPGLKSASSMYKVQHHDIEFRLQQARVTHDGFHAAHLLARREAVPGIVDRRLFEQEVHGAAREHIAQ